MSDQATRHAVIIPSTRRPGVLADTVDSVLQQVPLPDQIILVVVADADVAEITRKSEKVTVIKGRPGLTTQRNDAIECVAPGIDLVTFLDDDFELAADYLARARAFLLTHPDIGVFTGTVVRNGGVERDEAKAIVAAENKRPFDASFKAYTGVYGCNFTVRREILEKVSFDERFRAYGWLEDLDFGLRCAAHGKCVLYAGCRGVHLATTQGRISGVRMGFSQVMNAYYLKRKGVLSGGRTWMKFIFPALRNNFIKALLFDRKIDRAGRLRGNFIALKMLARGKCEPEYVERLK